MIERNAKKIKFINEDNIKIQNVEFVVIYE